MEAAFLGYTAYYFTRNNLPVVSREVGLELGYDKAAMCLIIGATGLAYGIGKLVLGTLSDKSNPRWFMSAGLLLSAALNFSFGATSSYWIHLVLWTLNGFVQCSGWPPCGRSLGHWYSRDERGTAFGFWNIAHNLGGGVIGVLAAAVAQQWGWRAAFYAPGCIAVVGAVYIMIRMRDTPQSLGLRAIERFPRMSNEKYLMLFIAWLIGINAILIPLAMKYLPEDRLAAALAILNLFMIPGVFYAVGLAPGNRTYRPLGESVVTAQTSSDEHELSFKEILFDNVLTNPVVWIFAIANFFLYMVRYSLIDWGPTYLKEAKQASIQMGGISTFVFEGAAVASTLLIGWISDRVGGRRGMISLLCMIPILGALLAMILMPPCFLWAQIVLFGVIGFFIYPPLMLVVVAGLDFTSKKAVGAAAGFIGLWGYLGKLAQAILLGYLAQNYGWTPALAMIGCAVIVSIAILAFTWNLKPRE